MTKIGIKRAELFRLALWSLLFLLLGVAASLSLARGAFAGRVVPGAYCQAGGGCAANASDCLAPCVCHSGVCGITLSPVGPTGPAH